MPTQYVKRNQMEFDFASTVLPPLAMPPGFCCVPWKPELLDIHADVKHRGFRDTPMTRTRYSAKLTTSYVLNILHALP